MPWSRIGATHAQLLLPDKLVESRVGCLQLNWDLERFDLLNSLTLGYKRPLRYKSYESYDLESIATYNYSPSLT